MGKYDGILICSDFDETLAPRAVIPERNIKAIKHFQENGGLFTVISGREADTLGNVLYPVVPNTYVGGCNGAKICRLDGSDVIWERFICEDIKRDHFRIIEELSNIDYALMFFDFGRLVQRKSVFGSPIIKELLSEKYNLYKISYVMSKDAGDDALEKTKKISDGKYFITRSSRDAIELQDFDMCKGVAARKIAERVGADKLICVGDYENDISMVKEADIGYAVGNACDALKAVADRVTVNATDGAIARIIEELG